MLIAAVVACLHLLAAVLANFVPLHNYLVACLRQSQILHRHPHVRYRVSFPRAQVSFPCVASLGGRALERKSYSLQFSCHPVLSCVLSCDIGGLFEATSSSASARQWGPCTASWRLRRLRKFSVRMRRRSCGRFALVRFLRLPSRLRSCFPFARGISAFGVLHQRSFFRSGGLFRPDFLSAAVIALPTSPGGHRAYPSARTGPPPSSLPLG